MYARTISAIAIGAIAISAHAQFMTPMRTIKKNGDFSPLKSESTVLLKFTYDNMVVGKYTEENYVAKKVKEGNEDKAGKGDEWQKKWVNARTEKYEPNFEELFNEKLAKGKSTLKGGRDKTDSKYTLLINTTDTEPGYNVGISRMPGYITAVIKLVETAAPDKVLAEVEIQRAPAQDAMGFDYDASGRIAEGYAKLGKELATWFTKKDWGNKD